MTNNRRFFVIIGVFLIAAAAGAQNSRVFSLRETLSAINSGSFPSETPEIRWDPFLKTGVFTLAGHNAAFYASIRGESGPVLFDNREILNLPLPYAESGELFFPAGFVSGVTDTFKRLAGEDLSRFSIAAIVIDPGHGGKDMGALGSHDIDGKRLDLVEKDIVLDVSKILYERLRQTYPDKRILMTREDDVYPTLDDRVILANGIPVEENEAIIYISVHANASLANPAARGYEVWYLPPDYERQLLDKTAFSGSPDVLSILNDMTQEEYVTESVLLSGGILRQFDRLFGDIMPSRGLKEEAWFVVRNAHMPSVLVELGFVSNRADALILTDKDYLIKFSDALYNGITEFVVLFERSGGFTAQY